MAHDTFAFAFDTRHGGFLNAPHPGLHPEAPFAVAGIAWDGATTHRPGARHGPSAIRQASYMRCDAEHPHFNRAPATGQLVDYGDLTLPNTSIERMREALVSEARSLIARHRMLWLGGDHSITLPLLRAYCERAGEPLALVHFDAHCDTWADHFGEPSGHGTWVFEAAAEGLIDLSATTQIGIRSAGERATREFVARRGGRIFTARELRGLESEAALGEVIEHVRGISQGRPTYLTLDIDCLDPAFAPGTGTPEPGGLTTNQVLSLLEAWAGIPWLGMDLCEVSPPYDHAELTSNAASVFGWTWLCGQLTQGTPAR